MVYSWFLCSEPSRDSLITQSKSQSPGSGSTVPPDLHLFSPLTPLCSSHSGLFADSPAHQAYSHLWAFAPAVVPFARDAPSQISTGPIPHSRLCPTATFLTTAITSYPHSHPPCHSLYSFVPSYFSAEHSPPSKRLCSLLVCFLFYLPPPSKWKLL